MTDQVTPAEAVEAAAKAAYSLSDEAQEWDDLSDRRRQRYRHEVTLVLEAAAPHMIGEAEGEMVNLKRIIALLVLDAGGRATVSRRDMAALSDETFIETTEDVTAGSWVIRVDPPDELEKRRKYAALDTISELGSDDPDERITKRSKA